MKRVLEFSGDTARLMADMADVSHHSATFFSCAVIPIGGASAREKCARRFTGGTTGQPGRPSGGNNFVPRVARRASFLTGCAPGLAKFASAVTGCASSLKFRTAVAVGCTSGTTGCGPGPAGCASRRKFCAPGVAGGVSDVDRCMVFSILCKFSLFAGFPDGSQKQNTNKQQTMTETNNSNLNKYYIYG